MEKQMEPIRPVLSLWIEITKENNITWEPIGTYKYTNIGGGGVSGPSSAILEIARKAKSLVDILLFIVPLTFFVQVSSWTEKYCYKDWVIETFGEERYGMAKTRRHFEDVPGEKGRCIYLRRQHQAQK